MIADDPRHGEYRGYLQHRKDSEEPCDACVTAAFRRNKAIKRRLDAGIRHRVPIGDEAWRALNTVPPKSLSLASGIRRGTILKLRARATGPDSIVMLSTRTAILTSYRNAYTPIGLARRLQAITAMGWSMGVVADGTPFSMDAYKRVRRGVTRQFVQHELGLCIVAAYEKYGMTPAPVSRSSTRTRKWAEAKGWRTALAWEDETIDDPAARPRGVTGSRRPQKTDVDEIAVLRAIGGDRTVNLTQAERGEVALRMRANGWPDRRIEEHTGIKVDRYLPPQREQVAA